MDLLLPEQRKKWSVETLTYGEWLRAADPDHLSDGEKALLAEERAWEAENPKVVATLDAMVGLAVVLRRAMRTVASKVEVSVGRCGPKSYPKGYRFEVFARMGRYLLARTGEGTVFQLRPEWVEPEA